MDPWVESILILAMFKSMFTCIAENSYAYVVEYRFRYPRVLKNAFERGGIASLKGIESRGEESIGCI